MAATAVKTLPKDAQVIEAILKDQGVTDYEPRLINQMLEFTYRYVTDVLDDAKVYASHASKKTIDTEDVRLAVQCRMDHTFTNPPPRDLLLEISRQKNQQVLPLIKRFGGTKLPPDRHCLCSTNYKLKTTKKHRFQISSSSRQTSGMPTMRTIPGSKMSIMPRTVVRQNSSTPTFQMRPSTTGLIRTNTISASSVQTTPNKTHHIDLSSIKRKREDDDYDQV